MRMSESRRVAKVRTTSLTRSPDDRCLPSEPTRHVRRANAESASPCEAGIGLTEQGLSAVAMASCLVEHLKQSEHALVFQPAAVSFVSPAAQQHLQASMEAGLLDSLTTLSAPDVLASGLGSVVRRLRLLFRHCLVQYSADSELMAAATALEDRMDSFLIHHILLHAES